MNVLRVLQQLISLEFLARQWRAVCFAALGAAVGMALFVAYSSRSLSYLGDSPETCVNCHVMGPQYATWQHSSHAAHATCNDCHVPHDSFASQYAYKARDGLWHATVFTMHWEPQVIRLSEKAVPVLEQNCRRCHERVVEDVCLGEQDETQPCWDCHRDIPHGTARSLSATPDVFRPRLRPIEEATSAPLVGGRRTGLDKEMPDEH
ncbi:MAG: cytochrome c nitrite reductase small subunit [Pirellulales bacterium]|nr:cytochrome c nitrite reductase small subunit [Pirellulales bacterium]